MNKLELLTELEKLASKNEGIRVLEDYHRGILDAIEIVKNFDDNIFEVPLMSRCDKCGGYMRVLTRNTMMCDKCFNTWNNI
jgi:hypothetical protein